MITRIGLVVIAGVSMLLAACGGTAITPSVSGQTVDVHIKLTEFKIESDAMNFEKGVTYNFMVTNAGAVAHEFVILPVGSQHAMPNMSGMSGSGMNDEDTVAHISESDLPPGASKSVKVVFKEDTQANELEIACYVPGHYEAGMKIGIKVN